MNQSGLLLILGGVISLGVGLGGCSRAQPSADASTSPAPADPNMTAAPVAPSANGAVTAPATTNTGTATNTEEQAVQVIAIAPKLAYLTSQDPNVLINVRSQPNTSSSSPHYGFSGDPVTLLQRATDADGATWYYLKFDQSGAKGWVRGDFVDASVQANRPTRPSNQSRPPAPRPPVASRPSGTPETYMTRQSANKIAVQITDGEFNFSGVLTRTSGKLFQGSDGRVRVMYDRGQGRVVIINQVTGTEFYNYSFTDINEGTL